MISGDHALPAAVRAALEFAFAHIGIRDDPPGSNRGPDIDAWAREFGSPEGSSWCALAVAKARKSGGLWTPAVDAGSCDEWIRAGRHASVMSHLPTPGAVVVYTNGRRISGGRYAGQLDAVHLGLVVHVTPRLLAIEGCTTLGKYDRAGCVQMLREVDLARVLTFIAPREAVGSSAIS